MIGSVCKPALVLASCLLFGFAVVGCSDQDSADPPELGDQSQNGASGIGDDSLIDRARDGGATPEQLKLIADGAASFREYQEAVRRSVSCIQDAGIDVVGDAVVRPEGYPEIRYSFAASSPGRSDEQTLELADGCTSEHSRWVEEAYLTSPRVTEARELQFKPYREALLGCLEELEEKLPDDATRGEILIAAAQAAESEGRDCLEEVGYS